MVSAANQQLANHLTKLETTLFDVGGNNVLWAKRFHEQYATVDLTRCRTSSSGYRQYCSESTKAVNVEPVTLADEISAEWLYTDDGLCGERVLYLHGGGWCGSSPTLYQNLAAEICRKSGCPVLLPQYRASPAHHYPSGLADCLAAYTHSLVSGPRNLSKPTQVIIVGDSVGGNLALALFLALHQRNIHKPLAIALMSPVSNCVVEPSESGRRQIGARWISQCVRNYLSSGSDPREPGISPIHGDFRGLSALLVQVGELDPVLEDAIDLVNKAQQADVYTVLQISPEMPHAFQRFAPEVPEARIAINRIAAFISSCRGRREKTENVIYPQIWQTNQSGRS